MDQKSTGAESAIPFMLSDSEIARRKLWLQLQPEDEAVLQTDVDLLLRDRVDDLISYMYEHFLALDDTRSFFPDQGTLERAQRAQKQYFQRLTKGNYDSEYVENRLRVGATHHNVELDPKWYIGAYNHALMFILPLLINQSQHAPKQVCDQISALLKIIFFDMGLAIETYIIAKESAITQHRDAIRELETERRVTKSILESAPIGIVRLDEDLVCLDCNDEFVEIAGGNSQSELIGSSLVEISPDLDFDAFRHVLSSEVSARRTADRLKFRRALPDSYWDWAAWPVRDIAGRVSGLVAMFSNATDRVLLQQQREDFVATLTHDLKTPVSATNRAVKFLLEGDFGSINSEQREVLETILQSNTSLYSLVQTLLDVYRFDSGLRELSLRKCNLGAVIQQLVSEIRPLAEEKNVVLEVMLPDEQVEVACDEPEIRRVLQNLIDNSLKFTPAGGHIRVKMHRKEERTVVSVEDTGRGIPAENMPKVFQRFWQAGSTGRHYASTGLGLYLCRRIIEAHGGKIWCSSVPGQGSTFSFEL